MNHHIKTLTQLKTLAAKNGGLDCFITLGPSGCMRSSKHLSYNKKTNKFRLTNFIDDSIQKLTPRQLTSKNYTNIGEAIKKNAFYYED